MTQLSALLYRVVDELPAVSESFAVRALADAAKEFCTRTHLWIAPLAPFNTTVGTAAHTAMPPLPGQQVAAIKDLRLAGEPLHEVDAPRARRMRNTGTRPVSFTQSDGGAFVLYPTPQTPEPLTAIVALTLALDATEVDMPAAIISEYGEAIAAGAKMRLVRMANQPWSNPDSALSYAASFYLAVNAAKSRALMSMGEAEMQVHMRLWA